MQRLFVHPKLLLIRHGQNQLNVQGRVHSQQYSTGLDETGHWQASRLVEVCRGYGVCSILASPEARALETAQIVADVLVVPLQCSEALRERNWGLNPVSVFRELGPPAYFHASGAVARDPSQYQLNFHNENCCPEETAIASALTPPPHCHS